MNKIVIAIGLVCLIFLVITANGCVNRLSNPAPGCNQIPGIVGGCFSKFAIINAKTEPYIPCLKFSGNNCNDPSLYITSSCEESVYINGEKIFPERCFINNHNYWIIKNNGKYEIISQNELSKEYLFNLPKAEFLHVFKDSCVKENKKMFFDIYISDKKYNISFDSDRYIEYGPEYGDYALDTLEESPNNCLDYTLYNFYNANCKIMEISTSCKENIKLMDQIIEPNKNCKINNSYLLLDTGDYGLYHKGVKYYQGKQIPPPENTDFFVDGKIDGKKFKISFTVTKKLCD